ncbi:MAG: hypothetical protein ACTSR2_00810 [Candidatus Hodarchaeales archaeon]
MKTFIREFPKKIHPAQTLFTSHLALKGLEAIVKEINRKKYDPLDGDETEAIATELLNLLNNLYGNK